jgi:hypothetical protein
MRTPIGSLAEHKGLTSAARTARVDGEEGDPSNANELRWGDYTCRAKRVLGQVSAPGDRIDDGSDA